MKCAQLKEINVTSHIISGSLRVAENAALVTLGYTVHMTTCPTAYKSVITVLSEQEMLSIISIPDQYTLAENRRLFDSVLIFLCKKNP